MGYSTHVKKNIQCFESRSFRFSEGTLKSPPLPCRPQSRGHQTGVLGVPGCGVKTKTQSYIFLAHYIVFVVDVLLYIFLGCGLSVTSPSCSVRGPEVSTVRFYRSRIVEHLCRLTHNEVIVLPVSCFSLIPSCN